MKKPLKISIIVCLLIITGLLYAATELQFFTAKNESDSILLEWKTGAEDNLNRIEVERSASEPNNYTSVGTVTAIGSNSYYYFRDNVSLSNNPAAPIYYYRLKLVDGNG